MAQQVGIDINKDGEFVIGTLVEIKGSWATVEIDGEQHKVRTGQLAMDDEEVIEDLLTDEDDDEVSGKDVFPRGYREVYVKTKVAGKTKIDCGDDLAQELRTKSLEEVAAMAAAVLGQRDAAGWIAFYTTDREADGKNPLNPGMVRMNLGNRIRGELKRQREEAGIETEEEAA